MRKIGNLWFPEAGHKDIDKWRPYIICRALNRDVLAVARSRIEGAWAAYIGAVPGQRHGDEWQAVAREGGKLQEDVARAIFPEFAGVPYAR